MNNNIGFSSNQYNYYNVQPTAFSDVGQQSNAQDLQTGIQMAGPVTGGQMVTFFMQAIFMMVMQQLQTVNPNISVQDVLRTAASGQTASSESPFTLHSSSSGQSSTTKTDGSDGVLMGAWIEPKDVGAQNNQQALEIFNQKLGHSIGLQNLFCNQNKGMLPDTKAMQVAAKQGTASMLSLRTANYADIISGKNDDYLKKVADSIKSVDGPVYLRMNWEMDGKNNQKYGTPDEFKKSWQYVYDYMKKQGVDNVKFVWAPNAYEFDQRDTEKYYPGDDYVDVIGADGYSGINGGKYQSPDQIFKEPLDFSKSRDKPFMVCETGVDARLGTEDEVKYIQQMQAWAKENPEVKGITWFSSNGHADEGAWSLNSSTEEWSAFKKMVDDPELKGQSQ